MRTPVSIEIAKRALGNPKDEVRLTAFSIISHLEKEINDRISFLKSRLKEGLAEKELLEVYKKLALLYWELLYFGLVDKELENFVVEETLFYVKKVLELNGDPDVYLVAGRIFLRKGDYEKAFEYLSKALECNDVVTKIRVIPYLAEIEFYRGNYENVKKLWEGIPLSLHPNVYFMKLLWEGRLRNDT
jgi:tetratricopeptide (TPR) repeat protein